MALNMSLQGGAYSSYSMPHYTLGQGPNDFGQDGSFVNVIRPDGQTFRHYEPSPYDDLPGPRQLQQNLGQQLQAQQQQLQQQAQQLQQGQGQGQAGQLAPQQGAGAYLGQDSGPPSLDQADGHEDDYREDLDSQDFDNDDDASRGSKRPRLKKPHLQGRFSGRLATKEDERRLAEECKLLGPLLGGVGKRGDKSRLTLAKIVRGIATGDIRRYCEERERLIQTLKNRLAAVDPNGNTTQLDIVRHEVNVLRSELATRDDVLQELADKGIITGFVPSIHTQGMQGNPLMPPDGRFTPYAINVRRDRPFALPQYMSLGASRVPPPMPSTSDFLRREHSAPIMAAAALSDGPSLSQTSRPSRPPLARAMGVMGSASEPTCLPPPMSSTSAMPAMGPSVSVGLHTNDIQQQLANLQAQVEQLQNMQGPPTSMASTIAVPLTAATGSGSAANNVNNLGASVSQGLASYQPARFAVQYGGQPGGQDDDGGLGGVGAKPGDGLVHGGADTLHAMPALDLRVGAAAAAAARGGVGGGGLRYGDNVSLGTGDDGDAWRL